MSIYPNFDANGRLAQTETFADAAHVMEEPITIKGFSATYDRKFNLGNFESLNPAITVWVKTNVPEGAAFDLHDCKNRLRQMARDNVRAQLQRLQGNKEIVFLGLRPPAGGAASANYRLKNNPSTASTTPVPPPWPPRSCWPWYWARPTGPGWPKNC